MLSFFAVVLNLLFALSGFSGIARCDVVWTYKEFLRKPSDTWAVGRVLRGVVGDTSAYRAELGYRHSPLTAGPSPGRLVEIRSSQGVANDREAAPGQVVAVFDWHIGFDCSTYTSIAALVEDSLVHITMKLRPDTAWVDGWPTFDVRPLGLKVYPSQLSSRDDFLSVEDYAEMVSLIPDERDWDEDCRPGVHTLYQWIAAHGRPFMQVVEGLVRLCERSPGSKANSLVPRG